MISNQLPLLSIALQVSPLNWVVLLKTQTQWPPVSQTQNRAEGHEKMKWQPPRYPLKTWIVYKSVLSSQNTSSCAPVEQRWKHTRGLKDAEKVPDLGHQNRTADAPERARPVAYFPRDKGSRDYTSRSRKTAAVKPTSITSSYPLASRRIVSGSPH